jgi:hypothetical protein
MEFPVIWSSVVFRTVHSMCIPSTYLFLYASYSNESFKIWKLTKDDFLYVSARFNISRIVSSSRKFDFVCNKVKKMSISFRNEKRQRDSAILLSEPEIENVWWRHKPLLFAFDCCVLYMCLVQFYSLLWYWIWVCFLKCYETRGIIYIYIYIL